MLGTFGLLWNAVTVPFRLPWWAFRGVLWAFDAAPPVAAPSSRAPNAPTSAPLPRPAPASRPTQIAGFAGWMLASAGFIVPATALGASGAVPAPYAVLGYIWASAASCVVAALLVLRHGRRERARAEARRERVRRAVQRPAEAAAAAATNVSDRVREAASKAVKFASPAVGAAYARVQPAAHAVCAKAAPAARRACDTARDTGQRFFARAQAEYARRRAAHGAAARSASNPAPGVAATTPPPDASA